MTNLLWRLGCLIRRHRHPVFIGDQPLLDDFNEARDRGLIPAGVTLNGLIGAGQAELDRQAGIS